MRGQVTDMSAYLQSLEMMGNVHSFRPVDVPRITQLINKSNQFNLTTRRRTEGEVSVILEDSSKTAFTVRLADRFGDYGLIAVVIGEMAGKTLTVDTWLMSCRVLERQVEEETLNELVLRARELGAEQVRGIYLPTPKNNMVRDLYPRLGFRLDVDQEERLEFTLDLNNHTPPETHIQMQREEIQHG